MLPLQGWPEGGALRAGDATQSTSLAFFFPSGEKSTCMRNAGRWPSRLGFPGDKLQSGDQPSGSAFIFFFIFFCFGVVTEVSCELDPS